MSIATEQDIALRDDLLDLSNKVAIGTHNVKQYKLKKMLETKRKAIEPAFFKNWPMKTKIHTQSCQFSVEKQVPDFNQTQKTFKKTFVYNKKNKFPKPNSLKKSLEIPRFSSQSLNKDISTTYHDDSLTILAPINKYHQNEREFNKGPLKQRTMEEWLNCILLQQCVQDRFQTNLDNSGLKKFGVDRNALMSHGIKNQDLPRVYNSLFVYTIGFNNLLKQISNNNIQILKRIWKVFSILVQYCSAGSFQTVVGQIQRVHKRNFDQLCQQLTKKQTIIQMNEKLNEQKNEKIIKEIRRLKTDNYNLSNEKEILTEDLEKTEQAFNEEVVLRLKFQNKINEIFGVHRQLGLKHIILYEDYVQKVRDLSSTSTNFTSVNAFNVKLKHQNIQKTQKINNLQRTCKYQANLITVLQSQKNKYKTNLSQLSHNHAELNSTLAQKQRIISQLQVEINNLEHMLNFQNKSMDQSSKQHQLSLEQNQRLYKIVMEQRKQIEKYLQTQKNYNSRTMGIVVQNSVLTKKLNRRDQLFDELEKKYKSMMEGYRNLELKMQIENKKIISYEEDLQHNYTNIQAMHTNYHILQQQVQMLRKKSLSIDEFLKDRDNRIQTLEKIQCEQKQQIATLRDQVFALQQYKKSFEQDHQATVKAYEIKVQNLQSEIEILSSSDYEKNNYIKLKEVEVQKYKTLFQNVHLECKNEKFQRHSLQMKYNNILQVMEKKNQEIKEMKLENVQLKDNLYQCQKKLAITEMNLKDRIQENLEYKKKTNAIIDNKNNEIHRKMQYVHPMIQQDYKGQLNKTLQQLQKLTETHKMTIKQYQDHKRQSQLNLLKTISKYQTQIYHLKKQYQDTISKKQTELQFEKQTHKINKKKLMKLQQLAQIYQKKIEEQKNEDISIKKYMQIVQEKKKIIDDLLKQLENAHDTNSGLKKQLSNFQKVLEGKDSEIEDLKNMIQYYEEQKKKYSADKQQIQREKQKIYIQMEQIKHQKQNLRAAVERQVIQNHQKGGQKNENLTKYGKFAENTQKSKSLQKRQSIGKKIQNAIQYYAK